VTCKRLYNGSALGNSIFVFNKSPMLSCQTISLAAWDDAVPSDVALCNTFCPSLNVSPAIEEGV
jgi:hypothetical protein